MCSTNHPIRPCFRSRSCRLRDHHCGLSTGDAWVHQVHPGRRNPRRWTEMDKSLRETFEKRQLGQSSGESEPEGWCTWAGASEMTGFVGFWLRQKTFFHHICMFCMFCVSSACSVPSLLRTPPDSPGHLDQHRQDVLILQIHRIWKRRLLSDHRGCRQGCEGVETFVFRQSGGHIFETNHFEILRILWCVKFLKSELWDFLVILVLHTFAGCFSWIKLLELPKKWPFYHGRRKPCRWWTSRERPSTLWIRSMSWNLMGRAAMSLCWSLMDMPCRSWGLHRTLMRLSAGIEGK